MNRYRIYEKIKYRDGTSDINLVSTHKSIIQGLAALQDAPIRDKEIAAMIYRIREEYILYLWDRLDTQIIASRQL